jgi:hypothetical protein
MKRENIKRAVEIDNRLEKIRSLKGTWNIARATEFDFTGPGNSITLSVNQTSQVIDILESEKDELLKEMETL